MTTEERKDAIIAVLSLYLAVEPTAENQATTISLVEELVSGDPGQPFWDRYFELASTDGPYRPQVDAALRKVGLDATFGEFLSEMDRTEQQGSDLAA